jgi:hypothetical protein
MRDAQDGATPSLDRLADEGTTFFSFQLRLAAASLDKVRALGLDKNTYKARRGEKQ